jgi:hypothetical protein
MSRPLELEQGPSEIIELARICSGADTIVGCRVEEEVIYLDDSIEEHLGKPLGFEERTGWIQAFARHA